MSQSLQKKFPRELEVKSIFLLREAYANFANLGMLWSIGKDSTVMLWLARKAFFGHIPFPLIHIDTNFKIPEMIAYRNQFVKKWDLELIIGKNETAMKEGNTFPQGALDRTACCSLLKTIPLTEMISGVGLRYRWDHTTSQEVVESDQTPFDAIIAGIRADEEGSRSKERYFSIRNAHSEWNVRTQAPEFWNQFQTDLPKGSHVRIHPLLDWTELHIWQYIAEEGIPTVSLYYDQGTAQRYRSLGCYPCTQPISSVAKNSREIVAELEQGTLARVAERSGRAQDKEGQGLETLRTKGYM